MVQKFYIYIKKRVLSNHTRVGDDLLRWLVSWVTFGGFIRRDFVMYPFSSVMERRNFGMGLNEIIFDNYEYECFIRM